MGSKIKLVAIVSVLINIFLVGFLVGDQVNIRRKHPPFMQSVGEIQRELSPENAKLFHKIMEAEHKKNRNKEKDFRQAREEIFKVLVAENFDANLYRQKAKSLHDMHGTRVLSLADAIADLAPKLSQKERIALARQLRQPPPRPSDREDRHHPPPSHGDRRHPPPPPRN